LRIEVLKAWLGIARVGNSVVIGVAAITGYVVCGGHDLIKALLLFLGASLVGVGGNVINDYFDRFIDSVNKPWRPIPSGIIKAEVAFRASMVFMALGTLVSTLVSLTNSVLALTASVLLYLYSWRLKSLGPIGNSVIASLSLLSIIYGGVATGNPLKSLVPSFYAFLIILGREFLKGLEDIEGDLKYGVMTLANTYGVGVATALGLTSLATVVVISPLPLITNYCLNPIPYATLAFAGVDAPIALATYLIIKDPLRNAWRATRVLKAPLLLGLLAFLTGCLSLE